MTEILEKHQTEEISDLFQEQNSPKQISLWEDFLVPLLALQEKEQGSLWRTREAHWLLKCLGLLTKGKFLTFYLRMSKDSSITMEEKPSELSFQSWMKWGMTVNGNCLTANISESHSTVKESFLSQILEISPDQKYLLSGEKSDRILAKGQDKRSSTPKPKVIVEQEDSLF